MAYEDFITIALNLTPDQIQAITTILINSVLFIRITLTDLRPECPYCGGSTGIKGYSQRHYNHLPVSGHPSVIEWRRRRYVCRDCGRSFSEHSPFGPENLHQTYALLNEIARDLHNIHLTFRDIATKHGISETTVQLYADSFLHVPRITLPESLGIDEIHSNMAKYGGSYLAVLVDNVGRCLCDILPNRSKSTLSRYFEQIPKAEREKVRFVTIDLWEPYKSVALKYLPNACIAADPFHVVEHLQKGFTRIRVDVMNQCVYGSPAYYLLKKWHKLLDTDCDLDNPPKYNGYFRQKMNKRDLYNLLLDLNGDLSLAYRLKEKYRDFNRDCSFEDAPEKLDSLIREFEEADLYCYAEFVQLLKNWRQEIINSFQRPFDNRKQSNALTEYINSRLRELLAVSKGFANLERFRAKAIYCLNDKAYYALTQSLASNKRKGKPRGSYNKRRDHALEDDPGNSIETMDDFSEDGDD